MKMFIRSYRGNSLLQVLVAVSIMSILSIILTQMMTDLLKVVNSTRLNYELNNSLAIAQKVIFTDSLCDSSLLSGLPTGSGRVFNRSTITSSTPVSIQLSKLEFPDHTIIYAPGASVGEKLKITTLFLKITNDLNGTNTTLPGRFVSQIHVDFESTSSFLLGPKSFSREIPLDINTTSGTSVQILGCGPPPSLAPFTLSPPMPPGDLGIHDLCFLRSVQTGFNTSIGNQNTYVVKYPNLHWVLSGPCDPGYCTAQCIDFNL